MKATKTDLPGVLLLEPVVHGDSRGFFLESYNQLRHEEAGVRATFVQDNHSRSQRGVLRGLHFQRGQGKLVRVVRGEIYDVAVDIRPGSETFGRWCGTILNDSNHRQLWVPPGHAHGFCVLSDSADVLYKVTEYYRPEEECGILWNDQALAVDWPLKDPILSKRDGANRLLEEIPREELLSSTGS